ncbi:Uma2 family endonuclease [Thermoflexus sp.]|uniref:Uma2 family endonuclease n=2 Tax=Thermoflexus sp. TaxID=1969742 RepID=UPI0026033E70|nr:Uma2 family endonuclease [Thermoflexus sp.]MCX7689613.1 Uma2 family endonuclease [Thermoflexus sp.]
MGIGVGARVQVEVEPLHPYLLRLYGVSEAEFEALADEDLKAEYLDGMMMVHSPASVRHEDRQIFLATLLKFHVDSHPPGRVLGGNALFRVGTRRFAPDVMVVREVGRVGPKEVEGPPDLAIEILSESTRDYDLGEKRAAYREVGIPEIWWVDLERQTVIVERRDRSYQAEAVAEGWVVSEVVPGFRIRAEWLWQEPLPSVVQCWEALRSLKSGG